jgi:hypothetical protein
MGNNEIIAVKQAGLKNPGDNMSARITDTGRQVLKVETNDGKDKRSMTRYPKTGTIVETKTTKIR